MRKPQNTKLNACMIVNQLEDQYFDWSDDELRALHASRDAVDHSAYTAAIVARLKHEGIEIDAAYTICHDKDTVSSRSDDSSRREFIVKPKHNHTVLKFSYGLGGSISQIAKAAGVSKESIEKPKQGRYAYDDMLAYLIHIKYVEKHQYDPAEVFTLCGKPYHEIFAERKEAWLEGCAAVKRKRVERHGIRHNTRNRTEHTDF